tara:strand:- start:8 stop:1402 length:1395 start_codon:yes stop_codon:yes gene_type:complete
MITLNVEPQYTDEILDSLKGHHLDDTYYDTLITEDCDCYREDGSILFKFRKNLLSEDECEVGFLAYKNLAKETRGRGASAGQIDPNSVYWKKRKILEINKGGWSAVYEVDGKKSKMKIQNKVASNAMGYWSETNAIGRNYPCRLTHYAREDFLKYEDGFFVANKISNSYKRLHPDWYQKQYSQSNENSSMRILDTPFSTITVNRNFRTAVHKDSGDFGFGNLTVLEYGHYHGGYFILPKYRVAIDIKKGDHLCVDVHEYHANTELYETPEDKLLNDNIPKIFKDNLEVGTLGLNNRYARLSLVFYLRDELKNCKMKLKPEFLKPELPPESKISVFFVNKLNNSKNRQKYFSTNWSRCKSHEEALHRIIKHQMRNVVIIDDIFVLVKNLGNSKCYPRDGITFLDVEYIPAKQGEKEKKGVYEYNINSKKDKLAYFIPDAKIATRIISQGKNPPSYHIVPKKFKIN